MEELSIIGKSKPRVHAWEKVTGHAKYASDIDLPGMLHAKVLRSEHPNARILNIDTSEAEHYPGVKAVITAEDTPQIKVETTWLGRQDRYPIAVDRVRYIGEEIAAVAAEDELTAEEALGLIKVDYEVLPAVFDPEEAMKPGAPKIHDDVDNNIIHQVDVEYGDVEKGFKEADYIFEDRFSTSYTHICPIEPTVHIASFDSLGKLTFWENSFDPFLYRRLLVKALGITASKIRIRQNFMGGNHGHAQTDLANYVISAFLAEKAGRPVRLVNSREEELGATRPRQPVITHLKYGFKKDGTLTARKIRTVVNAGPYSGFASQMTSTGLAVATGFYARCPNIKLEALCAHTNTLPVSPSRCFGIKQVQFAQESMMDMIAEKLDMDPLELRERNAVGPGDVTMIGQKIGSCGLKEGMESLESTGWKEKKKNKRPNRGIGIACAMSHSDGVGQMQGQFGGDIVYVQILEDGRARIISGEYEWGQGSHTVLSQMVAEDLDIPFENVEFCEFDSDVLPHTLGPYGEGRITLVTGNAVRLAVKDAKNQLLNLAAEMLEANADDLEMKDQKIYVKGSTEKAVSIADVASYGRYAVAGAEIIGKGVWEPDTELLDLHKIYGNYSSGYIYYANMVEVEVDPQTGKVKLLDSTLSMDVGKAINPMSVEGQGQGDVGQEMGIAMTEELIHENGLVLPQNFIDYKLPTAMDVAPIKINLIESNEGKGPYGAKGCAHGGLPTPAAIANAVYDAVGVRIKDLPITPAKILKALEKKEV